MKQFTLQRLSGVKNVPQFGCLISDEMPKLLTLELPYFDNIPTISCIPEGDYVCQRRRSEKVGGNYTYQVMNVPGREGILLHWGNTVKDTEGCILLGMGLGSVDMLPAILNSKTAHNLFLALTQEEPEIELFIKAYYGT